VSRKITAPVKVMRLDYAAYVLAVVFLVLAAVSYVIVAEPTTKTVAVATTFVLGFFSLGLGYYEKPKTEQASSPSAAAPQAPQVATLEAPEEEKVEAAEVLAPAAASGLALTRVKGIGEKREAQLRAIGINTVEELAAASVEDVAAKLKVYPKIVANWVAAAKELVA
jgi:predicted flap endonuclease-1-like 5' DNA nuclease